MNDFNDNTTPVFCVGLKETNRCMKRGLVTKVYVAKDADSFVTRPVIEFAEKNGLAVFFVETMKELGAMTGIDIGAAVAAEIKNSSKRR